MIRYCPAAEFPLEQKFDMFDRLLCAVMELMDRCLEFDDLDLYNELHSLATMLDARVNELGNQIVERNGQ